jgi:hypothetical protein
MKLQCLRQIPKVDLPLVVNDDFVLSFGHWNFEFVSGFEIRIFMVLS